jgi:hypothetical protein
MEEGCRLHPPAEQRAVIVDVLGDHGKDPIFLIQSSFPESAPDRAVAPSTARTKPPRYRHAGEASLGRREPTEAGVGSQNSCKRGASSPGGSLQRHLNWQGHRSLETPCAVPAARSGRCGFATPRWQRRERHRAESHAGRPVAHRLVERTAGCARIVAVHAACSRHAPAAARNRWER